MSAPQEQETIPASGPQDGDFDVLYRGRSVELVVRPPGPDGRPVTADQVLAALEDSPLDTIPTPHVQAAVTKRSSLPVSLGDVEVPAGSMDPCVIKLALNNLAAYAVPVPLIDGDPATPPLIAAQWLRDRLAALGIQAGLVEEALASFDPPRELADICCLARGRPPLPGRDGDIALAFDPNPRLVPLERDGGGVDFHAAHQQRAVQADAVLATYQPPQPGQPGLDLAGRAVPPPPVRDRPLAQIAGRNTEIRDDTLVATAPGRPVLNGGRIEVLLVYEVPQDLDYSIGNIDFSGDIVIRGGVKPGFALTAGGSVVVSGIVESSSITAEHDITVAGVVGSPQMELRAGGNLTARYLHNVTVMAKGQLIVAKEIVNCRVEAQRVVTAPVGRIVGGTVVAADEIDAGTLGSLKATQTHLVVKGAAPGQGVIRARRAAYAGVTVSVGSASLALNNDLSGASFWDVSGVVVKLGPAADEKERAQAQQQLAAAPDATRKSA